MKGQPQETVPYGKVPKKRLPNLGFLLLGALSIFWGISWPIMKTALGEIRPWTFRSLCVVLGGLGVLAMARAGRLRSNIPRVEFLPLLIVAFFNTTCWHLGSAYGLIHLKAGRAVIIAFTMPLWASLLGVIVLKERLTISRLVGLGLGMAALAILIGPDLQALGVAPMGVAFMLWAAMSWALGTVLLKRFRWTIPTLSLSGWQLLLGGIPLLLGALVLEPVSALSLVSWRAALATAYMIVIPVILCGWAWFKVVELFPAGIAAIGTLAIPVVGVFSSAVALGETVGLQEVAALVLMTMAISIVMIRQK